jgi:hypothetical protein
MRRRTSTHGHRLPKGSGGLFLFEFERAKNLPPTKVFFNNFKIEKYFEMSYY